MTKRPSIKIRLLHLGKKITHTQRGGFIPPLLVNTGKTILASLLSNGKKKKKKKKKKNEKTTQKQAKTGIVEKLLF